MESAETMYSAEEVPFSSTFRSFSQRARAGNGRRAETPSPPRPDLVYLDSLLMTLMRAPFSSFSL